MIRELTLRRFKNFKDATLKLGGLTVLVGTNASGKSNLRDAFRFLNGISRGYTLAEIIGEKWVEGGVLQWKGIRGGTQETVYHGESTFSIEAVLEERHGQRLKYGIEVEIPSTGKAPRVVRESLYHSKMLDDKALVFDSHPTDDPPAQEGPQDLYVRLPRDGQNRKHGKRVRCLSHQPALSQLSDHKEAKVDLRKSIQAAIESFTSMQFLDLDPDEMRRPSIPGQHALSDRGENLSSVLQAVCEEAPLKDAVLEWIRELTPQDVTDFEFVPDQTGKILVSLVESAGPRISAYSASDGTLRFLGMIAALLGVRPARFYFLEELENGIHPTRLHLLLQLIEQQVGRGSTQIVATSHSPQLLGFLNEESQKHASLVYRLSDAQDARIRAILDIPEAKRVLEEQDLARLHASGWLEDAVEFLESKEANA